VKPENQRKNGQFHTVKKLGQILKIKMAVVCPVFRVFLLVLVNVNVLKYMAINSDINLNNPYETVWVRTQGPQLPNPGPKDPKTPNAHQHPRQHAKQFLHTALK
jgi:hypothetical protein